MDPKYPNITVKLTGLNGNAFNLLAEVRKHLRKHGISNDEQKSFLLEAMGGDYDHLLRTCCKWVNVH